MQHLRKGLAGIAWARVVSTELFDKLLFADWRVHETIAGLHLRLGWESPAALAGPLKSAPCSQTVHMASLDTSFL